MVEEKEETTIEEKSEKLVGLEPERTNSKHANTIELTHKEVLTNDEHDQQYDDDNYVEGGNSEAVSISSSKLRVSPVQISNNNTTNIVSSSTREELLEKFGECSECKRPNTGDDNWCQSCNSEHFRSQFDKWKSDNENVDKIIRNAQLSAKNSNYVLEWIPYNKFKNVVYVAKGGYGTVYSAYWSDGHILGWDKKFNQWKRYGTDHVALKRIHNSQFITIEFLDQIARTHLQLHDGNMIIQYYGITRYPETEDYMIVMEFANQGSVRSYLNGRFNTMDWYGKINILSSIAQGLEYIHNSGYTHYNFHVGNVLRTGAETLITDIGIKKPTIKFTSVLRDKEEIYGVLPYLAPEVLYSKRFTSASDIYSFGVMMNEIISGLPPFNSVAHDNQLAAEICLGKRPEIPMHTPKLLEELIKRCWDTNPSSRPSAKELKDIITQWWDDIKNDKVTEISAQCKASDEVSRNSTFTPTPLLYVSHPEAVYHSRLLEFNNLPKPNKANRRTKLSSSLPYSETRQVDSVALEYQEEDENNETVSFLYYV
ncbi:kinase-like domain-containing protein [Rhizophagus clarus]|uniref:Kinase-like domain-containing protein n=1 Tax=Rhizophagus clarus TaxID=94130 RepID=A0A8H3KSH2_9GLOM|nr:kinase-like domain-containing protein [Rhizophagus clarus]